MSCGKPVMQCSSFIGQFGVSATDAWSSFGNGLSITDSVGRLRCMNPSCSRPLVSKHYACKRCGGSQHLHDDLDEKSIKPSESTMSVTRSGGFMLQTILNRSDEIYHQYENEKELNGDSTKANEIFNEWCGEMDKYLEAKKVTNRYIHESMMVGDPAQITFWGNTQGDDVFPEFMGKMISEKVLSEGLGSVSVETTDESRSYYTNLSDNDDDIDLDTIEDWEDVEALDITGTIFLSSDDLEKGAYFREKATAHEFGHHIEHRGKHNQNQRIAIAYWEARTSGEDFQPIVEIMGNTPNAHKYVDEDEIGKRGGFVSPYTGKIYMDDNGQIETTEILSIGTERIMMEPAEFYMEDPDHFEFMVRFLRGEFHSPTKM